jgi:hypothetical protein
MKTGRNGGRRTKKRRSVIVFLTCGRGGLGMKVDGSVFREGDGNRRNGQVWESHR